MAERPGLQLRLPRAGLMREGTLVLVVGPSGAGKDALLRAASAALNADPEFEFPQRIITRPPDDTELHSEMALQEFERAELAGAFALSWAAHGYRYGIPRRIDDSVAKGKIVVANVSRGILEAAGQRYRNCVALLVTASPAVLADRLARRGRESRAAALSRIERPAPPLPAGVRVIIIENNGTLTEAADRFLAALHEIRRGVDLTA